MKITKSELIKEQSQSVALSDGLYNSQIVGYMVSERVPFNKPDDPPYQAVRFAMALVDDNDNQKIVQTPDYRLSFSERSNFYKQLASWAKSSSPEDLWTRMEDAGFVDDDEFNLDKFLGLHVSLMTTLQASKKDASKLYPNFVFTPSKKGQAYDAVAPEDDKLIPIWLPSFIEDADVVETKCVDFCEWKRYEERQDEPEATIGKSSRKQANESEAGIPANNDRQAPAQSSTPKLKVRTRKTEEEIDF